MKRHKDQEIINMLISERDDIKFLNTYLEEEIAEFKKKEWLFQKTKLNNEILKKQIHDLTLEINMLQGNLTMFKIRRQRKSRNIFKSIDDGHNVFDLKKII